MNNVDNNNNNNNNNNNKNKIQINDFQEIKNEIKRKIGKPPFIRTDKTIKKKCNYLF
jgi:hypothetical protein